MSGTAGKMTEFTVKLADTPVCIRALHPQMKGFLREYLSEEKPELVIETKQEDIERERREDLCTREREGLPRQNAGDAYLETLAIYRQLAEKLAERNVLLFHGSALAMDGEAYLFAARSGTGKSTHARLWREAFGERVVMINDDKPLLQVGEEGVRVFGTPWNGKHRLGNNASAPLKALCFLERDSGNRIERIGLGEAFPLMLQQCYLPENLAGAQCVLAMLEKMGRNVKLYRLGCNMEADAALVSYRGMQEEN